MMVGTLIRLAVLSSIVGLLYPMHDQLKNALPHSHVAQGITEQRLGHDEIIADGAEPPTQAVHSDPTLPIAATIQSLHLEKLHLSLQTPSPAQRKALLKLAQEVQSPDKLQRDLAKNFRVTAQQHGWTVMLRKGIKTTIGAIDGMRKMLVSSEKNLR